MKRVFVSLPLTVLLLAFSPAFSVPILDQHQETQNDSMAVYALFFGMPLVNFPGQTFTAGLSGRLDHIEVGASGSYPTTVEIRDTAVGAPGSNILGSVYMPTGFVTGWNSIDFLAQNITTSAGSMYSIVLWNNNEMFQTNEVNVERWTLGVDPDPYTTGQLWKYDGSTWYVAITGGGVWQNDMQFRTYVETVPIIPAPGAIVLAGIGATVVGWLRSRRTI